MTHEAETESPRDPGRLSASTVAAVLEEVERPGYVPSEHGVGIVHIGVGAFHRAHQAVYTDSAIGYSGGNWRIAGVALRTNKAASQLNPQDGLYTLVTKDQDTTRFRVIGSIDGVSNAYLDSQSAISRMLDEQTRIVSLTITEKGYFRESATGDLDESADDIRADLRHPWQPRTAIGCLVEALRRRKNDGSAPFTVLSCDNLPGNGLATKHVVEQYAGLVDATLAAWINENVSFPSTMVDRICPSTTEEDLVAGRAAIGFRDEALVVAEPFSQWVVEDSFPGGRPKWEAAGVELVDDVSAYETAKLRLLNGSHSTLAYLGALAGDEFIHQVLERPFVEAFIDRLMLREIAPTLPSNPNGSDQKYLTVIKSRFRNSSLPHRVQQVAMDGTQKLAQRILIAAERRLAMNGCVDAICLSVALWLRYVTLTDDIGRAVPVDDPLVDDLRELPRSASVDSELVVERALAMSNVFGAQLRSSATFREALSRALNEIVSHGAEDAVRRFMARDGLPGS